MSGAMTGLDDGIGRLRSAAGHLLSAASAAASAASHVGEQVASPITRPWERFTVWLTSVMPKGL
ncbi:MAG: hypothetical protein WBF03_05425, partial [Xanthobacteraceae bacterium]